MVFRGTFAVCRLDIFTSPAVELLRSIVTSMSVCLSVCPRGYLQNHTRDFYQFLCMLPASVARSSSDMFTIGRISPFAGKGFSSPLKMHYRPRKGIWECTARANCAVYTCSIALLTDAESCEAVCNYE